MDIEIFEFPTLEDGITAVEKEYCKLLSKFRAGESLTDEQKDWMDAANNWLIMG